MNWKNEAIAKLKKYGAMKTSLVTLPQELRRLEGEFTTIRAAKTDATPVQGGGSKREDAMISNIVERSEVAAAIENATAWVQIVERGLGILPKEERQILKRMYVYPEKNGIQRLCDELGMEHSSVYRRRDKALQTFTLALYGALGEDW